MRKVATLTLSGGVMLMAGYGIFAASAWPWKAALFPLAIGVPLFCLAATEALWALLGAPEGKDETMEFAASTEEGAGRRILAVVGWMLAFFAAIALLGFPIAVPLFVLLYLKLQGGEGWILSVVTTAAVAAIFFGLFDALLHLPFPSGWLLDLMRSWLGLA